MLWLVTPSSKGARVVEASHQPTTRRSSTGTHSMHVFSLVAAYAVMPPPRPNPPIKLPLSGSRAPAPRDCHNSVGQKLPRNETQHEDPTTMGEKLWSNPKHESEPRLIPRQTRIEAGTSCS